MKPTTGKRLAIRLARLTAAVLCAAVLSNGAATAQGMLAQGNFWALDTILRPMIVRNPDIIGRQDELLNDPASPVGGNPDGDVTLVEFFDYQCPYCKTIFPSIQELLAEDRKLRFVFKEIPVLGKDSVFAARAALAARRQGKYLEFHMALMPARGKLTESRVMGLAEKVGLDVDRLRRDMAERTIGDMIRRNLELADALGIDGTPAFIIGDTQVPGAVEIDTLKTLIARARQRGRSGKVQ
ncbi:MAG: DsbA family protein [Proteobacteria bacterium]|nr:DsbA family protein [Pseudomonadota bacterium]